MNALRQFLDAHPADTGLGDIQRAVRDLREAGFEDVSIGWTQTRFDDGGEFCGWELKIRRTPDDEIFSCENDLDTLVATARWIAAEPDLAVAVESVAGEGTYLRIDVLRVDALPAGDATFVAVLRLDLPEPAGFSISQQLQVRRVGEIVEWARRTVAEFAGRG